MSEYLSPGVYVEEVEIGAKPIEGVGTSTTAFIGGAKKGPILEPTLVTGWSQFEAAFGGLISSPRMALGYAVDAFFRNGGKRAYIVRVAGASAAKSLYTVLNGDGAPLFKVEALEVGADGDNIKINISNASISGAVEVFKDTAAVSTVTGQELVVSNHQGFAAGDNVIITGDTDETAVIKSIDGNVFTITGTVPPNPVAVNPVNIEASDNVIRLTDTSRFYPGSIVHITDSVNHSYAVVDSVGGKKLVLKAAVGQAYLLSASPTVTSMEFDMSFGKSGTLENYHLLAVSPEHPRFFARLVQSGLVVLTPEEPLPAPVVSGGYDKLPPAGLVDRSLSGGGDDDLSAITYTDGLEPLTKIEGINLLAIPGQTDLATQTAMIDHCEKIRYRFAVLDAMPNLDPTGVKAQRAALGSKDGYAALYYPWLKALDPASGQVIHLPPSGHVCGIYARTDSARGVHKAPANEKVAGVIGLERIVTKGEQEVLNPDGINVIRFFSGKGNLVWGARTLADNTLWKYINVRRLFLNIEESIERATHWVVFEPNDEKLWARVRQTCTQYLTAVWKSGALMGTAPEEAFFVKCDRTTMTQSDIDNGRLIVQIGVAPVKPAEFVIFRIAQWQGGSAATE